MQMQILSSLHVNLPFWLLITFSIRHFETFTRVLCVCVTSRLTELIFWQISGLGLRCGLWVLGCTHWCVCGAAACRSSEPLWRNNPPRCSRARTRTRRDARAPSAAPACCCRAAWPPAAPNRPAGRRPRPAGCGCGACWGSGRGPPRCAGTSAGPGWWTDTCWCPPPAAHRRTGAAAAEAPGGGATSSDNRDTPPQKNQLRLWDYWGGLELKQRLRNTHEEVRA